MRVGAFAERRLSRRDNAHEILPIWKILCRVGHRVKRRQHNRRIDNSVEIRDAHALPARARALVALRRDASAGVHDRVNQRLHHAAHIVGGDRPNAVDAPRREVVALFPAVRLARRMHAGNEVLLPKAQHVDCVLVSIELERQTHFADGLIPRRAVYEQRPRRAVPLAHRRRAKVRDCDFFDQGACALV